MKFDNACSFLNAMKRGKTVWVYFENTVIVRKIKSKSSLELQSL